MTSVTERDRTQDRYVQLSHRHAAEGDVRRSQLAAWASDVHVLEALLWQNGLGQAPDPGAQLAAVGESVAVALETLAERPPATLTARQVVEAAREAMVTTFDESVHGLLTDRFATLDHLDACEPVVPSESPEARAARRLDGRTPEELAAELRATAADCMAVAELMDVEGETAAAGRLARQADAAAFEAHLVTSALLSGDERLVTVDLRWELASGLTVSGDPEGGSLPDPLDQRRVLGGLVGSAERDLLDRGLEPLPGS